jgi:hypothetical protein
MKGLILALVLALVAFGVVGNVVPAGVTPTAMAIRHAVTGTGESVILSGPNNLFLLAAKLDANNVVFACINGNCQSVYEYFGMARTGNMVSMSTWGQFSNALFKEGWQVIQASALPASIRESAAQPTAGEFFKGVLQWFAAALTGGGSLAAKRKLGG